MTKNAFNVDSSGERGVQDARASPTAKRKEPGPEGCSKQRVNERTSLTHRAAKTKEPDPAGRLKIKSLALSEDEEKEQNQAG